jgi:hypothetical protein
VTERLEVIIGDYSEECPDISLPSCCHVYAIRDLGHLAIHPLCCGSHTLSHSTALVQVTDSTSLGTDTDACAGCATWLRCNPHAIVVDGVTLRVADLDDVTISQRGKLDRLNTLPLDPSAFLPLQRSGQKRSGPAVALVGA